MISERDMRKVVLIMTVGLCDAIANKVMSINEAEHYLFSPNTMALFKEDAELMDIIHRATEFEDFQSMLPAKLAPTIADVKERALKALGSMPECDYQRDSWLLGLLPMQKDSSVGP